MITNRPNPKTSAGRELAARARGLEKAFDRHQHGCRPCIDNGINGCLLSQTRYEAETALLWVIAEVEYFEPGMTVEYFGSLTALHGPCTLVGPCDCDPKPGGPRCPGYELSTGDGLGTFIRHVSRTSFL